MKVGELRAKLAGVNDDLEVLVRADDEGSNESITALAWAAGIDFAHDDDDTAFFAIEASTEDGEHVRGERRRNVCGYCEADFGFEVDGVHERRAELQAHVASCEKNPLVAELAPLRVERLAEDAVVAAAERFRDRFPTDHLLTVDDLLPVEREVVRTVDALRAARAGKDGE